MLYPAELRAHRDRFDSKPFFAFVSSLLILTAPGLCQNRALDFQAQPDFHSGLSPRAQAATGTQAFKLSGSQQ
jgi:hypothetical protein